jgi:hypothetical protein
VSDQDKQAALFAALSRAVAKAQAVGKDSTNTFSHYKYASAEALIEESRGCLAAEGLAVMPKAWRVVPLTAAVPTGSKVGMYFADVVVTYLVTHKDGGFVECEASTPACTDNGRPQDKAVATALTYSLGYFLRSLLLLPRVDAEHDVDKRDDRPNPGRDERRGPRPQQTPPPERQPVTPAKPDYDVEKVINQIRAATDADVMQMIADNIANEAPKSAMPRLRAEWGKRKKELLEGKAAA